MIKDRLDSLRQVMKEKKIDYYLVPTEDPHGSEYVGEYYKCREYLTGFTGSAGTALSWQEGAGRWTDARYHIQGDRQLCGRGVTPLKEGEETVPCLIQLLENNFEEGQGPGAAG